MVTRHFYRIALSSVALLFLQMPLATADFAGFKAGLEYWQQNLSGDISSGRGASIIDVENDLAIDRENNINLFVAFEHPIPTLPNIRLQYGHYETQQSTQLSRSILYDKKLYSANERITSNVDLKRLDIIAYYELIDQDLSIDLGLTLRAIDASASLTSNNNSSNDEFTGVLPLLYGHVRFDIPTSNFYASGSLHGLKLNDDTMIESQIKLGYEFLLGFAFEVGYRSLELEQDDKDDLIIDMNLEGLFAGIQYKF